MRIALLGAGRIGQLHGRLVSEQADVEEVIVYDVIAENAAKAAAAVNGRVAATAEDAIAAADAVIVAASTNMHAPLVSLCIDAGKPVFVEKPLAFDLESTVSLVEKAEAAGAVIQVGFQRRFDPAYVEAKRLLDTGELGTLYMVRLIAHDHTPPPDAYIPVSGGLFRDSSIHDFDALRWLTGSEVVEVYATGSVRNFPIFAEYDDVDTGACIFTCANGVIGSHAQTRHNPLGYDVRMEVIGSKDVVCVGLDGRTPMRSLEAGAPVMANPAWDSFLDRFEEAYRLELLEFLRVARGEIESPCTARDAMQAMRIAYMATKSRLEHRPVRLDEVP
jgi:myo-inositol 2-dehydrogenase / D-chiro-inositol 1-dehydrogenase